jgi:hypothetical protein
MTQQKTVIAWLSNIAADEKGRARANFVQNKCVLSGPDSQVADQRGGICFTLKTKRLSCSWLFSSD